PPRSLHRVHEAVVFRREELHEPPSTRLTRRRIHETRARPASADVALGARACCALPRAVEHVRQKFLAHPSPGKGPWHHDGSPTVVIGRPKTCAILM